MLAALAITAAPRVAVAQAPSDVATQVGVLAEQMLSRTPTPWLLEVGGQASSDRGNADFNLTGGNLLYLADTGTWRFGASAGAVRTTSGPLTLTERYAVDIAAERPIRPTLRLMLVGDWLQSPFDGLEHRAAAGALVVHVRQPSKQWGMGVFGGLFGVREHHPVPPGRQSFPETVAGARLAFTPTAANAFTALVTHMQEVGDAENYRLGVSLSASAQLVGALGLRISFARGYDHEPVEGRKRATQNLTAAVTVTLGPKPPPATP